MREFHVSASDTQPEGWNLAFAVVRLCVHLIDWLIDWLIDGLIGRLIDWLIDWFLGFRMQESSRIIHVSRKLSGENFPSRLQSHTLLNFIQKFEQEHRPARWPEGANQSSVYVFVIIISLWKGFSSYFRSAMHAAFLRPLFYRSIQGRKDPVAVRRRL